MAQKATVSLLRHRSGDHEGCPRVFGLRGVQHAARASPVPSHGKPRPLSLRMAPSLDLLGVWKNTGRDRPGKFGIDQGRGPGLKSDPPQ